MSNADPKATVRSAMRARRRALDAAAQQLAAARLDVRLAGTRWFRVSRRIACYLPNDGEIDPRPIIERIRRMRKTPFLPVLSRLRHDRLWFAEARPDALFKPNRFGIPEPVVGNAELVRAADLDLVLVPLVAFDSHGNRIGMGGGFYDRSLAFLRHRTRWRKPHVVGVAHDFQRVETLTADPWDIPLAVVVTDAAVYEVSAYTSIVIGNKEL